MSEFKKASEVADRKLNGLSVLKMREGEDSQAFTSRLTHALYGENDLPRPSHKVPTDGCDCKPCQIWHAGREGVGTTV